MASRQVLARLTYLPLSRETGSMLSPARAKVALSRDRVEPMYEKQASTWLESIKRERSSTGVFY